MLNQTRLLSRVALGAVVGFLGLAIGPTIVRANDAPKPTPPAAGQSNPGGPKQFLSTMRERLNELNLTQGQKPKVDALFAKANEGLKKLLEDASGDPQERQQKGRELFNTLREQVGTLLDDTQKAKAKEIFSKGRGGGNGNAMEALKGNLQKLDLSDAQKERVKTMMDDMKKKFEELRAEGSAPNADRAAITEKLQAASQDIKTKLMDILTDEQAMKLKELTAAGGTKPAAPKPN